MIPLQNAAFLNRVDINKALKYLFFLQSLKHFLPKNFPALKQFSSIIKAFLSKLLKS